MIDLDVILMKQQYKMVRFHSADLDWFHLITKGSCYDKTQDF